MSGAGEWAIFCLLAVVTKLSSSVDDVAWLLPYINSKAALVNALYVFLMECVVGLAIAAGIGGREAMSSVVSDDGYWNTERVLSLVSGCLLTLYAVYLFYDWWTEMEDDDDDDDKEASESETNPASIDTALTKCDENISAAGAEGTSGTVPGSGTGTGDGKDLEEQQRAPEPESTPNATLRRRQRAGGGGQGAWTAAQEAAHLAAQPKEDAAPEAAAPEDKTDPTTLSLVTVAILGSLDDFCVFFGLLLADTFHPLQLAIGVLVGSCLVVLFCKGATFFEPVVWLLERIPLWAIIGCFAAWTFISAFVEF